jgi:hypothetical protein
MDVVVARAAAQVHGRNTDIKDAVRMGNCSRSGCCARRWCHLR